jgi:hypothetical protein
MVLEKIAWIDQVRNEKVLHRVKGKRNVLHTIKRRKGNWPSQSCIGSVFSNTLLKEIQKE